MLSLWQGLIAEHPNHIITHPPSGKLLPLLDPFANLVADQHSGVLRSGHTEGETAVIEVLTGAVENSHSSATIPFRGGVEEMPDRTLGNPSTTTLGAITLLAFLNLLGYIQNVLTGTSGRKRRSVTFPPTNLAKLSKDSQVEHGRVPSRAKVGFESQITAFFQDMVDYIRRGEVEDRTRRLDRLFAPRSHYLRSRTAPFYSNKLAPAINRQTSQLRSGTSRPFPRTSPPSREGIGSFFSSAQQRLKVAASVMGFLNNPSPSRVRRELEPAIARSARMKRFTTAMNAWYDDLAGQNYDGTRHTTPDGGGGLLNQLMLGLSRRILGV